MAGRKKKEDTIYNTDPTGDNEIDFLMGVLNKFSETKSDFRLNQPKFWFSTGNFVIDMHLGNGFPGGTVCEVAGNFGSGKSAMALSVAKQCNRIGGTTYWIDAEIKGLDWGLANDVIGLNTADRKHFLYKQEKDAVKALTQICEVIPTWIKTVDPNKPVLVVLDSLAGLDTETPLEGKIVTGKFPQLIDRFFRKMRTMPDNMLFLLLNQLRANYSFDIYQKPEGPKFKSCGGRALEYFDYCKLTMTKKRKNMSDKVTALGNDVTIKFDKLKCSVPYSQCTIPFYHRFDLGFRGFDEPMACIEYLIQTGVMKNSGPNYLLEGENHPKNKWRRLMAEDPVVYQNIKDMVALTYLNITGANPKWPWVPKSYKPLGDELINEEEYEAPVINEETENSNTE